MSDRSLNFEDDLVPLIEAFINSSPQSLKDHVDRHLDQLKFHSTDITVIRSRSKELNNILLYIYKAKRLDVILQYENIISICIQVLNLLSDKQLSQLVCSNIELSLLLMKTDVFYPTFRKFLGEQEKYLNSDLEQFLIESNEKNLNVNFYFLGCLLSVYELKLTEVRNEAHRNEVVILLHSIFDKLFTLSLSLHDSVSSEVYMLLLPKVIILDHKNLVLELLWSRICNELLNKKIFQNENLKKVLNILCCLADYYIDTRVSKTSNELQFQETFWSVIQAGLLHQDLICRKQALYLLKRSIEVLDKNKKSFFQFHNFWWDFSCHIELVKFWESMFLVLEILEEKQIHLITPIFPEIEKLIEISSIPLKNSVILPFDWVLILIHQLLCHDSNLVIKWGIIKLMSLDVCLYCKSDFLPMFIEKVIKSINDINLFYNLNDNENNIHNVIKDWFVKWNSCCHNPIFFSELLKILINISWCPVPLFHIVHGLAQIPPRPLWCKESFATLKYFISETLRTQNVFIRGAIQSQLLKTITRLTNVEGLSLVEIAGLLSTFKDNECFRRKTESWNLCVFWLKTFVTREDANILLNNYMKYVTSYTSEDESVSAQSMARLVVLLYDANLIVMENNEEYDLFISISDCFVDCDKRLYSCEKTQDIYTTFLSNVLEQYGEVTDKTTNDKLLLKISGFLDDIIKLIKLRMSSTSDQSNLNSVDIYIGFLSNSVKNKYIFHSIFKHVHYLHSTALNILNKKNVPIILKYFATHVEYWVLNTSICWGSSENPAKLKARFLELFMLLPLNGRINHNFTEQQDCDKSSNLHNIFGKLKSGSIQALWSILHIYFTNFEYDLGEIGLSLEILIEDSLEAISIGGRESVLYVMKTMKSVLHNKKYLSNYDLVSTFIHATWTSCFELRKTDLFWHSIQSWIQMVFQYSIIDHTEYRELLLLYGEKIIEKGQELNGLFNILVKQIKTVDISAKPLYLSEIIIKGLLFGPVQRRDEKIEKETCQIIQGLGESCSVNMIIPINLKSDAEVRICCLDIILSSLGKTSDLNLLVQVVEELMIQDQNMSKNNPRYFNDSRQHRVKNRCLQAILIFETALYDFSENKNEDLVIKLYHWVQSYLVGESQQPSIRYQLEWLMVRLLLHYSFLREQFWTSFEDAGNKRVGSVCSFISVAYHVAKVIMDDNFFDQCVGNILPWCMGQNFNVRLYAQTVLHKLWDLSSKMADKYDIIKRSQENMCDQGNTIVNIEKLRSDFYFSTFHPTEHFTLQTIFWDLPRLSNIAADEWVPLSLVSQSLTVPLNFIKMGSQENDLSLCASASWVTKGPEKTEVVEVSGIQKKFVPWKWMFDSAKEDFHKNNGMILIASLIDKPTNLGGLARTCDVFSASELVICSLQYVLDKQFTSLSTFAEKHVNISEVKPHNLATFLKEMKKLGYSIIGAEQTTESVNLSSFKFPVKTALLLGNEKEGIPVNLLPLLDYCVEIPQFGVIRSLNVHVTGAILLWEYAKQHLC